MSAGDPQALCKWSPAMEHAYFNTKNTNTVPGAAAPDSHREGLGVIPWAVVGMKGWVGLQSTQ